MVASIAALQRTNSKGEMQVVNNITVNLKCKFGFKITVPQGRKFLAKTL